MSDWPDEDRQIGGNMDDDGNDAINMMDEPDIKDELKNINSDMGELDSNGDHVPTGSIDQVIAQPKEEPLEDVLELVHTKLNEKSSIDNKINAFKTILCKIQETKLRPYYVEPLCSWLIKTKIVERFLHDDSHTQILRNMSLILKFLYDQQVLELSWIRKFMNWGLTGHEQFLKVNLFFINCLKLDDLVQVFGMLAEQENIENPNFVQMISSIVSSKVFSETQPFKKIIKYENEQLKENEDKFDQLLREEDDHYEDTKFELALETPLQQTNKKLAFQLFQYLIDAVDKNSALYVPILNKLIAIKFPVIEEFFLTTLIGLLKKNKFYCLHLIENCLKMDFGQNPKEKEKGERNAEKCNFIMKLVNEGLYDHITIILARNRFNKAVADKALNVFVQLSKNLKRPLEVNCTMKIWKILGLNSRDEKEREQFFTFVKDCLRHEFSFTEESVQYIFFEILIKLQAEWFSLKIFDCFQVLFMRLNQDLKLLSYEAQSSKYSIQDCELIGLDKFWYIYFNVADLKVAKKCRDLLWKLSTYESTLENKKIFLKEYIERILKIMESCDPTKKEVFTERAFDMIDRMSEQAQKKDNPVEELKLVVRNQIAGAEFPKQFPITISEKACLSDLKEQISTSLNPPKTSQSIRLILCGKFLRGEKMTLKQLALKNDQTVMVTDEETTNSNKQNKEEIKRNTEQLIEFFGEGTSHALLGYIAQKMEGETIERIMDTIMDETKMARIKEQFELKQQPAQQDLKVVDGQGQQMQDQKILGQQKEVQKQPKFSYLLVEQGNYISKVINCAQEGDYLRGWQTIKKLPYCEEMLKEIKILAEESQWFQIFDENQPEMSWIYNAHLLKRIIREQENMKKCLIYNGGYKFLVGLLSSKLDENCNSILLELITSIILFPLRKSSTSIDLFVKRTDQNWPTNLLNILIEESYMENQPLIEDDCLDEVLVSKIMKSLLDGRHNYPNSKFPALNMCLILVYSLEYHPSLATVPLSLSKSEIYELHKLHGYMGEYLVVMAMAKCEVHKITPPKSMEQILKEILGYCLEVQPASEFPSNLIAQYDLATIIINRSSNMNELQKSIIEETIHSVMKMSNSMAASQLQGNLDLLKVCIRNIYQSDQPVSPAIEQLNTEFGSWLFSHILFNLHEQHPFIRDKSIRKICNEILCIISEYHSAFAHALSSDIAAIDIQPRNKDEDYVDFRTTEYIGINNLGATCYINSLLQQIYHTQFSRLFLQIEEDVICLKELKTTFMRLYASIKNAVNLRDFVNNTMIYGDPINPVIQQDACEFLFSIFDTIDSQPCEKYKEYLHSVFGGVQLQEIRYHDLEGNECVSENEQHFYSLPLDIKGKKNLIEALNYFVKHVDLDGDNRYSATFRGKEYKTKATKRSLIKKMPNILILTLKRFEFEMFAGGRIKLNDYFEFPLELDLHKYSEAYLRNKSPDSVDSKYRLTGILVHSGSAESGHYYSYIKVGEKWLEFNDKKVSEFNISSNLKNECFGCSEGRKTRSAYILFYEKINSNSHGVYLSEIPESNRIHQIVKQQNAAFLKSRLVQDPSFKDLVRFLHKATGSTEMDSIIQKIEGKKQEQPKKEDDFKNDYKNDYKKEGADGMVYFDADGMNEEAQVEFNDGFYI